MSVVKRGVGGILLGSFACVSVVPSTISINFNRRHSLLWLLSGLEFTEMGFLIKTYMGYELYPNRKIQCPAKHRRVWSSAMRQLRGWVGKT